LNPDTDERFLELIRLNPAVGEIVCRMARLNVPDVWLVSGCLFQTVWNVLADEPPTRAIRDYDIFYFDETDTSAQTEEGVNRRAKTIFEDLGCEIDVRNQARVHLWYESEFGVAGYPRLTKATDGIDNFLAVCCMVGIRQKDHRRLELYAPFGTDDILERVVRPNPWYPNAPAACYESKAERWRASWPALRVEPCRASCDMAGSSH